MANALIDYRFAACPENLQQVRAQVRDAAAEIGCDEPLIQQLVLAIDEACTNIIRHAYCGDRAGQIRLQVCFDQGCLEFRLRDQADPVNVDCIKPRDLDECRPGGLGINLIDSVMDHWQFSCPLEGGNLLLMRKRIEPPKAVNDDE